jgi:putative tryptophan/tyrosine transport system substrate-binding protein
VKEADVAARALGVQLQVLEVGDPSEFESAFSAMTTEHAEALVVTPGPIFSVGGGSLIADLATRRRLPTMFESKLYAVAGGLMAYGPNLPDLTRRSATYVDRLKGANPADLPVEQPMRFDFVVNLKTARELGITFPQEILLQVTEVIQ